MAYCESAEPLSLVIKGTRVEVSAIVNSIRSFKCDQFLSSAVLKIP